MMVLKNK